MAKNKMSVDFSGLDDYIRQLEEIGGGDAVERAFDAALLASEQVVKESVSAAMEKHNRTGATAATLISGKAPEWTQSVGKAPVGFEIPDTDQKYEDDRLASVFLMYGTKVHGQPHVAPDRALYNAVYGAAVRKRVQKIQEEAFDKVLRRLKAK